MLSTYPIYNNPNLCICEWRPGTREMHEHYSKLANLSQKEIAFLILLICRDAYWKIAGEQMGLGKPWEPDYKNPDIDLYVIISLYNRAEKATYGYGFPQCVLAFPTKEMRDAFFENFKELIKQCKRLI